MSSRGGGGGGGGNGYAKLSLPPPPPFPPTIRNLRVLLIDSIQLFTNVFPPLSLDAMLTRLTCCHAHFIISFLDYVLKFIWRTKREASI